MISSSQEPLSRFFYSRRLKLHYWDYRADGKPTLILVHGSRDHARSWDAVAFELRKKYHVFALDLRGHGDSEWAPGAMYSIAEHVFDLAVFCEVAGGGPVALIGHSLGGMIVLAYAGSFPETVSKLVAIEGLGMPLGHHTHTETAPERMRRWFGQSRELENTSPKTYKTLDAAIARMREANPHLCESMARHLTLHGSNRMPDGSYRWKFDPFVRARAPYGLDAADAVDFHQRIACPVLLFRGMESWDNDPQIDGRASSLKDCRVVNVPGAGHWVHHDRLDVFLAETRHFLDS